MKLAVITTPTFFGGEEELVRRLFDSGLERLHLRKPGATREELARFLDSLRASDRARIVLHDHFRLCLRYGCAGVHLNSRNPSLPAELEGVSVSRSCHSLEELGTWKESCNYLFLSPIYDSISKEGYGSAFPREELEKARESGLLDSRVYALGGVSLEHIDELRGLGFGGVAVLGALWQSSDPVACLRALLSAL
ncbi:MAG: thiamine phosphate synthase [Candidatus Cryptobacteroides sp.]